MFVLLSSFYQYHIVPSIKYPHIKRVISIICQTEANHYMLYFFISLRKRPFVPNPQPPCVRVVSVTSKCQIAAFESHKFGVSIPDQKKRKKIVYDTVQTHQLDGTRPHLWETSIKLHDFFFFEKSKSAMGTHQGCEMFHFRK